MRHEVSHPCTGILERTEHPLHLTGLDHSFAYLSVEYETREDRRE